MAHLRSKCLLVFCLAVLLIAPAAQGQNQGFDSRVEQAINKGVAYLREQMRKDPWGKRNPKKYPMGRPAVEVYALLKSGVSAQDRVVNRALEHLMRVPPQKTYGVSLYLMALDALLSQLENDYALFHGRTSGRVRLRGPKVLKIRRRMSTMTKWLLKVRRKGEGVWNYRDASNRYDNSNTQFAVLALGVAAKRRLNVPLTVWKEISDHFIEIQEKDGPKVDPGVEFHRPDESGSGSRTVVRKGRVGEEKPPVVRARGWGYQDKGSKLTMTAAGLSSLILAKEYLFASGRLPVAERKRISQSIWDSCAWLARNKLNYGGWYYYGLYSVEKVGDLGRMEKIGDIDWYKHGAELILKKQKDNGSWGKKKKGHDHNCRYQTSLALLFLNRATDLFVHSKRLYTGKEAQGSGDQGNWLYVPRLQGQVSMYRMFRKLKYQPSRSMLRVGRDMVESAIDSGRAYALVPHLIDLTESPFKPIAEFAMASLSKVAGKKYENLDQYREWADKWRFVMKAGRKKDSGAVSRLCKLLKSDVGAELKKKIIWALEMTRPPEAYKDLVALMGSNNVEIRERAYSAIKYLSGERFPFNPRGTQARRNLQLEKWKSWAEKNS